MQTVFVTGANGFVGSYVVKQLLEKKYRVIASGRSENAFQNKDPHFHYHPLDFTNKEMTLAAFEAFRPAVVVHCGAMSKPDDCEVNKEAAFLTNVTGTKNLLEAAAQQKAHFIFLSTDFVFSGAGQGMYKEENERAAVNYYGQTKVLAEDEVMNHAFDWAILRTVLVYGKSLGKNESFLEMVVRSVRDGKDLKIFNDQVRTPTYVEDLAAGIVSVIEKKAKGIFHLSGRDAVTVYDMACTAISFNGLDASRITAIKEGDLLAPAKRPKVTGFNVDKAKRELDYQPLSFTEGLKKTFDFNV